MKKTGFVFTIDTEFSLGGYFKNNNDKPVPAEKIIWCKIGNEEYGINLIMDILDQYDLKGVFFMETESRFYFGEQIIIDIIKHIRSRGHEVQLHIHPTFRSFIKGEKLPDDLRKYSYDEQVKIILEALVFLGKYSINDIIAYRSGGFYSNNDTLKAIEQNNLFFASNYNLSFPNCDYINDHPQKNDLFQINNIYELPITCFKEPPIRKRYNSFQLEAASFKEIQSALSFYGKHKINLITYILHSFEFVKRSDHQFNQIKPQKFLIRRFKNICKFLADHKDEFQVFTFNELKIYLESNSEITTKSSHTLYKSGFFSTVLRYWENTLLN